jgi:hypothetical protein
MPCLNCGALKTIDAHLIPKSFVSEVKADAGEQHLIVHVGKDRPTKSHTGVYDRGILCGDCDSLLGDQERYSVELLRQARMVAAPSRGVVTIEPIDGDRMVRFAAGIAWKYAVTTQPGRINVGPYVDRLRDVSLRNAPIPPSLDVAMLRILELDGDVYFYRTPMPDRKEGINVVRFSVGSFLFFLKIDKRSNGSMLPSDCWLRGRRKGAFVVMPAELTEEGRMHRSLASSGPSGRFFREMRARKVGRSWQSLVSPSAEAELICKD